MELRKARIGLILPSVNVTMEPDFYSWAPPGVTFHSTRAGRTKLYTSIDSANEMLENIEYSAKLISHTDPDITIFGCTSATFLMGAGGDIKISSRISKFANSPSLTTSSAVIAALKALEIHSLSVLTPYSSDINEIEVEFLQDYGFKVANIFGYEIKESLKIPRINPQEIYDTAKKICVGKEEALFISCTNLRAGEVVEELEKDLGIPVITSNQASLWALLRYLGFEDWKVPYTKLFSSVCKFDALKGWVYNHASLNTDED